VGNYQAQKNFHDLKMELLSNQIEMDIDEKRSVHRLAKLIGLFYTMFFLRSRIAVLAPLDDFHVYGKMSWYKSEDPDVTSAVMNSISRHL
jgi:hypothetical protein